MLKIKFLICIGVLFISILTQAHHYKGLPHYSYFENYPQVPTMEFVGEDNGYEIFVTVYNFQGLEIDLVEDPDVIRLYIFIYHIATEKIYKGLARFEIYSHGLLKYKTQWEGPEQENIFVLQNDLKQTDDLILKSYVKTEDGKVVKINLSFKITKSFFQKYGLYIFIVIFFLLVAIIKTITLRRNT